MGKFAILAVLSICLLKFATAEWHLIWEDQFNGEDLYRNYQFATDCSGWGNDELQCYTANRPENARQENGNLVIQARREWWGDGVYPDKPFTSTRIRTNSVFLYGKFEIRARLPKGKHLWPAFWMYPAWEEYGEWPRSGEIDIMEYRGQRPSQLSGTLHYGPSRDQRGMVGTGDRDFPVDFSEDFHVFGIDWSPQKMMWMVDGQVYHEENLQRNFWEGFYNAWGQPFDRQYYMIINLAVGGNFFGGEPFDPIEADQWRKPTFEIDWLRAWEWR